MVSPKSKIATCLICQVKAFHPVFLDIAERVSSQIEGLIAAREEGRPVSYPSVGSEAPLIFAETA
jgi:hypothetical protein